jgi:glycosyltransferase involved in cell wall biosynthesis
MPIRICSIINGTSGGAGAERMLQRVIRYSNTPEFEHLVISINNFRRVAEELTEEGIEVQSLGIRRRLTRLPFAMLRMGRLIRKFQPDVVQTWLYLSDLSGGVMSRLVCPSVPVVWTIRHCTLDRELDTRGIRITAGLSSHLSGLVPSWIVLNSHAAVPIHTSAGYASEKMTVIPNGFDTSALQPSESQRNQIREEFGFGPNTRIVGRIARFHPQKDHLTFLRAARIVHDAQPDVRFVMVGEPLFLTTRQIRQDVESMGLLKVVRVEEFRSDIAALNNSFDIATCSSVTEAFPNALGEAMACGVPCVSTDVGDAARIVGHTGHVVPRSDPEAFAGALSNLLARSADERRQLGLAARRRIIDDYQLDSSMQQYVDLWRELADRTQASSSAGLSRAA